MPNSIMPVAVISLFPQMFDAICECGITGRMVKNNKVSLIIINPRDFTTDVYRRVDDRPFGGGPGMVMMAEPLTKAIQNAKMHLHAQGAQNPSVIYLSPQGATLTDALVDEAVHRAYDGVVLLCGRYEGVDERVIECYVDQQISIGDYVLSGGELAAMVYLDAVIRKLPCAIKAASHQEDSFAKGLLDCPHYTKPVVFEGQAVPDVLLSGHHQNINKWRFIQSVKRTRQYRPDVWKTFQPTKTQRDWLVDEFGS